MVYLFAGYLVLWALIFGYLFTISHRQKRLEREIALLAQAAASSGAATNPQDGTRMS